MPLIAQAYIVFASGLTLGYAHLGLVFTAILGMFGASALTLLIPRGRKSGFAMASLFAGAIALAAAEGRAHFVPEEEARKGVFQAARDHAGKSIEAIFREDAPLAKALLIADRQQILPEMNDAFIGAGLVHILSISGLHVGIIAASVALLLESARLSRRISGVVTLVVIVLYVALLGWQPPALRAAAMVGAVTLGKLSQRPTSPWALLSIGAFIPLLQPGVVSNLGYQLSVAGMAALIAGGIFARRFLKPKLKGVRLKLCTELSTSIIATLVSAPLIAWVFGRVSLIGPLANIAATPIVVVLQPLLFLALLLAPIPAAARFAADASHPLLHALDFCAHFFSAVPGAVLQVTPSWPSVVFAIAAVCALLIAIMSRFPARSMIVSAACCAIGMLAPFPVIGSGKLEMHMLDVGQGDAILLRSPAGRWILVDAGRAWTGGDAGRSVIIPYVKRRGGELAAFILSHPHLDHVGGAATILRGLHPRDYWDAAFAGGNAAYRASLAVANEENIAWHRVHPGDSISVDGAVLTFLAPDSVWTSALNDANEASSVVLVRFGLVRFLLTGDAEQDEEHWLLAHSSALQADVLKVGHHGSSTSSGDEFISKVCPEIALISVGALNGYGHPSGDVIAALRGFGAQVLRTDHEGTIVVRTDGQTIEVQTADRHWEYSKRQQGSFLESRSTCRRRLSSGIRSSP